MSAAAAIDHWRNRPARERWLIGVPAAALALVAAYVIAWEPLRQSTERLAAAVPVIEAKRERIRAETAEVRGYAAALQSTAAAPVNVALVQVAIERHQLRGAAPAIERVGDNRVRLVLARVAFHGLWPLLQDLQRNTGVRVVALRVDRIDAGHARVEASLATGNGPPR